MTMILFNAHLPSDPIVGSGRAYHLPRGRKFSLRRDLGKTNKYMYMYIYTKYMCSN